MRTGWAQRRRGFMAGDQCAKLLVLFLWFSFFVGIVADELYGLLLRLIMENPWKCVHFCFVLIFNHSIALTKINKFSKTVASGINIYSQLLISTIRIVDIKNSNSWYQQFQLLISTIRHNCWYQEFEFLISAIRNKC